MPPFERPSNRDKILEATMNLVRSQGVGKLTIEAAARAAGVSKGGVLYHFPSKTDLVRAMLAGVLEQWEALHAQHFEREPDGPYRWMRSCIQATFDADSPCCKDPLGTALLAGLAHDPELVDPLRERYRQWMEKSTDNVPNPALVGVIALMGDGLAFHQLLGLNVLSPDQRNCIKNTALDLLK